MYTAQTQTQIQTHARKHTLKQTHTQTYKQTYTHNIPFLNQKKNCRRKALPQDPFVREGPKHGMSTPTSKIKEYERNNRSRSFWFASLSVSCPNNSKEASVDKERSLSTLNSCWHIHAQKVMAFLRLMQRKRRGSQSPHHDVQHTWKLARQGKRGGEDLSKHHEANPTIRVTAGGPTQRPRNTKYAR